MNLIIFDTPYTCHEPNNDTYGHDSTPTSLNTAM